MVFFWAWNSKSGIDVSDTDKVFKRTEKDHSFLTFQWHVCTFISWVLRRQLVGPAALAEEQTEQIPCHPVAWQKLLVFHCLLLQGCKGLCFPPFSLSNCTITHLSPTAAHQAPSCHFAPSELQEMHVLRRTHGGVPQLMPACSTGMPAAQHPSLLQACCSCSPGPACARASRVVAQQEVTVQETPCHAQRFLVPRPHGLQRYSSDQLRQCCTPSRHSALGTQEQYS